MFITDTVAVILLKKLNIVKSFVNTVPYYYSRILEYSYI